MNEQQLRQRIYDLIVIQRKELGMTYDEIEVFWDNCIKIARRRKNEN